MGVEQSAGALGIGQVLCDLTWGAEHRIPDLRDWPDFCVTSDGGGEQSVGALGIG